MISFRVLRSLKKCRAGFKNPRCTDFFLVILDQIRAIKTGICTRQSLLKHPAIQGHFIL